ncbi:hypothetical protein, partial [Corynebacterium sp.]|uniref:hypothetical protein n=1 Tax=Corynebacterium sp. TaxID=1720 RepID=UPI0026DA9A8B
MSDSEPNSRDEKVGADNEHPTEDHPTEAATVMGTRAVPFDPFADDDDDDEIDIDINDIGSLLQSDNPADT